MLTALQLGNFKSWREVNVPLAPITGFFGTNSSGKSSLLQALLLMKQTVESSDQGQVLEFGDDNSLVQLSSYKELIWNHDSNNALILGFMRDFKNSNLEILSKSYLPIKSLEFECRIVETRDTIKVDFFRFTPGNSNLPISSEFRQIRKFYKIVHTTQQVPGDSFFGSGSLEVALEEVFLQMYYLGPLRDSPKRFYSWSGAAPSNVGKSGENTIAALLAARVGGNKVGDTPLENYIAEKLKQLGLIDSFRLEELREGTNIFRVLVRRTPESPEVSLTDVGFGVSQVLPVLVLCYYVPEGSTILLEQPELHLHPSVQSGLADIFIDAYKTRGVQIILESHSEHLLQRLQRRIAEEFEGITNTDISVYFCRLEHGESKLESLELDEYGNIHNYPEEFFGDRFAEMVAVTEAGIARREKKVLEPV